MNKEKKEKLEDIWDCIKTNIAPILIIVAFAVVVVISIYKCVEEKKMQNTKENGIMVEAIIVDVRSYGSSGMIGEFRTKGDKSFETIYSYIDEAGIKYKGTAQYGFNTYEDAAKYIGTKVKIYIDGKGNSIVAGGKTNPTQYIIVAIVFFIMDAASIAFFIWSKIPYRNKNDNDDNIIELEEKK